MKYPKTDKEWQEAVDAAFASRMIHDARLYGLISGGPRVDAARCDLILDEGAKRGVHPRTGAAGEFTAAYNSL